MRQVRSGLTSSGCVGSVRQGRLGAERGAYAGQYQKPADFRKQGSAAPMSGKVPMTAPQYSEFVRLMRNPKTSPEQLDAFAAKHGRSLGNAPELLSFMRRNPRAIVNNVWQQEDAVGAPVVKDGQNVAVRHLGALNEGIADTLGAPVDLVNLGLSGLDYAADKIYNDGIRLSSDQPFLGSESIRSGFHAVGIGQVDDSFAPRSTLETYTQAGAMAGNHTASRWVINITAIRALTRSPQRLVSLRTWPRNMTA